MLSVVLPSYNEEKMIQKTTDTISRILEEAKIPYELVFVNDGSKDGTWKEIEKAEHLDRAVDEIRNMFGDGSIFRGTFANSDTEPMQGGVNDGNYIMMGGYKQ